MIRKEYKIYISFKTKEEFLKAFNELYKKGFGTHLNFNAFENSLELKGVCFNILRVKDALKILKKFNSEYFYLETKKIEFGKEVF